MTLKPREQSLDESGISWVMQKPGRDATSTILSSALFIPEATTSCDIRLLIFLSSVLSVIPFSFASSLSAWV